jgi:hypothetical protein
MKNKIKFIVLFFAVILLTGCTNIQDLEYFEIEKEIFSNDPVNVNTHLKGFSFYLPNNMTLVNDLNNNCILYSAEDKYYLYIDLVGYYEKVDNDFIVSSNDVVYSNEFIYENKNGYTKIYNSKDEYLLEFVYNHAKIELVTNDINKAYVNSALILNSISYNDKVIESLIGNGALSYNKEKFILEGPSNAAKSFLQYEEEFGEFEDTENELPDEDIIDIINYEQ